MKKVFICSPFGGVGENLENAKMYCRFATANDCAPFAPHLLYPQFLDDKLKEDRDVGINCGLEFLHDCDEIWIFDPGSELSKGMKREVHEASFYKIPILFMFEEFEKWKINGCARKIGENHEW